MFGFQHSFQIDTNVLTIIQHGDNFELRINNLVFSHLLTQSK